VGVSLAAQPKDADHPYGHKKYETFFSLGIAVLLGIVSFNLIREGISRLYNPIIPRVDIKSFVVMIVTLCINLWVMNYEYKKGIALQSDMLISDSLHTKADIFTSLSVIITLVVIKLGYPVLDPLATIIIALFIGGSAFEIAYRSSKVLCDTAVIVDIKKITDIVLSIQGVKTCHKVRTRGRPDDIHIDLHVQVDSAMHMDKAHQISYTIEEAIKKNIPGVTDVVVHMEPK
jgi:cation diffusion facilitator family transporter